ncbi:MAG TPA: sulfatase [Candidatus Hydrogenedentes bacterium]|nr:sulfatase [Candidatus Hydrogenedentota bacterium]HPG65381.1 sulfatase [Candidatus Hydrogenedentota bacterium]
MNGRLSLRVAAGFFAPVLVFLGVFGFLSVPSAAQDAAQPALERWRNLADPSVPRLEEIQTRYLFHTDPALFECLGEGWREEYSNLFVIHSECLWATSIVSELEVIVMRPSELTLNLVLRPHFIETMDPQKVDVVWNDMPIGECAFKKEKGWDGVGFTISVPPAAQRVGKNRITFLSRYALSAKDVGRGGETADSRRIGFGLISLQLVRPDDPAITPADHEGPAKALETPVAFDNGAIVQPPDTRITFPFCLPRAERCALQFGDVPPAAAKVLLRWDTPEEVRERPLEFEGTEANLSPHAGMVRELVFDTTGCSGPVTWPSPAICASPDAAKKPPAAPALAMGEPAVSHVVIVVLDALRASGIGVGGAHRRVSPTVDALASKSVVFDRAYSAASWTYPSVVSILTGLYPLQHRVYYVDDVLSADVPTLQETLQAAGVRTGLIGENTFFGEQYKLNRGFDTYRFVFPAQAQDKPRASDEVTGAAVEFMTQHKDERFFLYVHYFPPHAPYAAGNPHAESLTRDPVQAIPPEDESMHRAEVGLGPMSREGVNHLRARYDENVFYGDACLGKLIAAMRDLGLGPETAIFILADHGEEFAEHGCLGHSDTPYETLIRVPFIVVRGPEPAGPGARATAPVRLVDLFPTICRWFGVEAPGVAGNDLSQPLAPDDDDPINYAQSQNTHPCETFVWSRYKLIRDSAGIRREVYDLVRDPEETCNLVPLCPVMTDYLTAHALRWRADKAAAAKGRGPGEKVQLDAAAKDALKALGYL